MFNTFLHKNKPAFGGREKTKKVSFIADFFGIEVILAQRALAMMCYFKQTKS